MGDHVTIGDALMISGFSIAVVFLGLIVISLLISALKNIGGDKPVETAKPVKTPVKKDSPVKVDQKNLVNDEELVAVISAAIAASMGVGVPEINIKSIRRTAQTATAWSVASRQEQMSGNL